MQGQAGGCHDEVSDYRKTDVGYMVPYAMDIDLGGQFSLTIAVKKVELNKTIDPAIFAMPKARQRRYRQRSRDLFERHGLPAQAVPMALATICFAARSVATGSPVGWNSMAMAWR